jgi:endonuclease-3
MPATSEAKRHAAKIVKRLAAEYPVAECALTHRTPLELVIATILSAQCTDARVNIVTRDLFKTYRTAADFAAAPIEDLEKAVQSTGFFRNKARNIKACCRQLLEEHGGKVPREMDAMVKLAGVGRKTANVVLGTAFGLPTGVVVDTHVGRLSKRMGLTQANEKDAIRIERDLMELLPKTEWIAFSHRMIHHGRKVCAARKPLCDECVLNDICPRVGVERKAGSTGAKGRKAPTKKTALR